MNETATKLTKEDIARMTARRYLADKALRFVLGRSQPSKLRQMVKGIEVEPATMRLLKDVMGESDRFETIDRRWSASARLGDSQRPVERVIRELMQAAAVPAKAEDLAQELGAIFDRSPEHFENALPRILGNTEKYFGTPDGRFGPTEWLLLPTADEEENIVFDNFLSEDQVAEFTKLCPVAKWKPDKIADTTSKLVQDCKEPIPVRILALMAWRELGEDYDPVDFYCQVESSDKMLILSDQRVYPASAVKDFETTLSKIAEELAKLPVEADEEETEGPIEITDTDKEEIIGMILSKGSSSAEELLDAVLEISPEESAFAGTLENLRKALEDEERIMWLGGTTWGKKVEFPEEITKVPEPLIVPVVPPFETPEGDIYDQELEEDGFEGDLKTAVFDPLAEDVTDEDADRTLYQENGDSQRCVLKYHHKTEGTFPLCQINPDFFGKEPEILPITLVEEGKRKTVYVNNSTRLIYGLKDFYKNITEVSGSVFYIEKTAKPGEYRFRFDGEVDEQLGIDTDRSLVLLDLRGRYESTDMPLYDVITDILDQHKQGMTFAQLVTEVNIVRRCSRLLLASILSSYHTFHTRGKSNLWQYDEKKKNQGFIKAKRKYIKKEE